MLNAALAGNALAGKFVGYLALRFLLRPCASCGTCANQLFNHYVLPAV